MNLLFHGLPDGGKTEFARYLAETLDRELIQKGVSDLLSMWPTQPVLKTYLSLWLDQRSWRCLFVEGISMVSTVSGATKNISSHLKSKTTPSFKVVAR